ncbi:MAG: TerC family protein [Cyanobacteriota bacterium]|jgi:YkoY family integral membrane protein
MEAETVPSLSPLLIGADQWHEFLLLLPLLVALEAILSADNAIALAAISRRLHNPLKQRQALNVGLLLALGLRLLLIAAARWVLAFWPLQLAAASYLLWLSGKQLWATWGPSKDSPSEAEPGETALDHPAAAPAAPALRNVVLTLAITDLAFSLDSIAAAVAVTDRLPIVMAGGVIGVLTLRLTAGLFSRWLEIYPNLETAGYVAVGLVGLRLLARLGLPDLAQPEWLLLVSVGILLVWGFSVRQPPALADATAAEAEMKG